MSRLSALAGPNVRDIHKTRVGRGAFIENITADDLHVSGTTGGFLSLNLLSSGIQDQDPVPGIEGIPSARNLCPQLVEATRIHPEKPLEGFALINVTGDCSRGIALANTRKAELRNVKVSGLTGPLLSIHNVSGKGLEGAALIEGPKVPEVIPTPGSPYKLH